MKPINKYYNYLLERLKKAYKYQELRDDPFGDDVIFERTNGKKFVLSIFPSTYKDGAFVLEYAHKIDSPRSQYEDGDLFYVNDMTQEKMYEAIINEIEDIV